jgi:anti-anti-sigma factor
MQIRVSQIADVVVLKLSGDFTQRADIAAAFWSYLQNGSSKFIVDFRYVSSINSAAFCALIECQRLVESSGGSVRICNLDSQLKKDFKAYGMEGFFSIFHDQESALTGLTGALPVNCTEACQSRYLN